MRAAGHDKELCRQEQSSAKERGAREVRGKQQPAISSAKGMQWEVKKWGDLGERQKEQTRDFSNVPAEKGSSGH